jgi:hypothetical protein
MSRPKRNTRQSAEPIKADDDEGNPWWWGPVWDAALDYESKLLTVDFKPRADVEMLSRKTWFISETRLAELTPEAQNKTKIDILERVEDTILSWGHAAHIAWKTDDVEFFEHCARHLANMVGERKGKKRKLVVPLAVTVIETARNLAFKHERHPTKMEVQEAVEKLKDNHGEPLVGAGFRWEWSRWHLSFLPGKVTA